MKRSWTQFFRRLANTFLVSGGMAWSSALCYAQIAADSATDPVYADGWDAGDDGGFGFSPWNFDSTLTFNGMLYYYTSTDFHAIDDGMQGGTHYSNPFNQIGRSWAIGSAPSADGVPRAGRGFAPLEVGQSVSIVVDNPTERGNGKGYIISLNTGGGNICYGNAACTPEMTPTPVERLGVYKYDFGGLEGVWQVGDLSCATQCPETTLLDTDTDTGMQVDVLLTGTETYELIMTPLDNPGLAYIRSGSLGHAASGAIDWLQFTFFNTVTDTGAPPTLATDFYISSMQILPRLVGDMDRDLDVDFDDIDDFVLGLNNPTLYESIFGVLPTLFGDTDNDTDLDFDDIPGFVAVLSGGNSQAVPEPSTFALIVLAAIGATWLRACPSTLSPASGERAG